MATIDEEFEETLAAVRVKYCDRPARELEH
jgi:hypothetical protein